MAVDQPRDPGLETVLELFGEIVRDSINVMVPGKILSYDATKQSALVQALVRRRRLLEDGETVVVEDVPPIHNVPVEFCGPARGRITWPVAAGDICEVRFSSASLARWVAMVPGATVDPGDDRKHDFTDAVCFVGLHSPASPPTDAPTDAVVIHASGGTQIKLGSSGASQAVVVQSALDAFITAITAAIATVTGSAGDASELTALKSALGTWAAGTTKTKAE